MKQIIVGDYYLGRESVRVVGRDGGGGEFYLTPEPGKIARIKLGLDAETEKEIIETLIHEAQELLFDRASVRFEPTQTMTMDHSDYIFMFSHVVFSDVCCKLADFLNQSQKEVIVAWKKWKKT